MGEGDDCICRSTRAKRRGADTPRLAEPLSVLDCPYRRRIVCFWLCALAYLAADARLLYLAYPSGFASAFGQARTTDRLVVRRRAFHHRQPMDCGGVHLSGGDAD